MIVVGAGLAGLRTAEKLRSEGWSGEISVVGAEAHMPYNRPPLTKEVLRGGSRPEDVALRRRRSVSDVDWRIGEAVTSVDLDGHTARLSDGTELRYVGLVVASGVVPRRLPLGPGPKPHVLRTLDDAAALHRALRPGKRVLVIGAGFVGCEIASSAVALGARVDVVDPGNVPLLVQLGVEVGAEMQRRHEHFGTKFWLGRTVRSVAAAAGGTQRVELDDDTTLTVDVVVEATGSVPNVAFLDHQGLDLTDGVLCDQDLHPLRAGAPVVDVVVVGDVARVPLDAYGGQVHRVEHWAMAVDTAAHAAPSLLAGISGSSIGIPFGALPSFWSDQHGVRLQSCGIPAAGLGDVRVLEGDLATEAAVGYHDDDGLVGVVLVGMTSRLMEYRDRLAAALLGRRSDSSRVGPPTR